MDMTNLHGGNGYFNIDDFMLRLKRFTPTKFEYYQMEWAEGRDFIKVGLMTKYSVVKPMFQIYAGNEQIFEFLKFLFVLTMDTYKFDYKTCEWSDKK